MECRPGKEGRVPQEGTASPHYPAFSPPAGRPSTSPHSQTRASLPPPGRYLSETRLGVLSRAKYPRATEVCSGSKTAHKICFILYNCSDLISDIIRHNFDVKIKDKRPEMKRLKF
ncbi:protein of unknown function [Candidatus Methylocalor cossyra]|uniref:Uncharacterized protein n=1 Tax=Candidatus Methylocalor cossyra TaxID=3108543 RepID=A0ABP1C9I2_9GAMM